MDQLADSFKNMASSSSLSLDNLIDSFERLKHYTPEEEYEILEHTSTQTRYGPAELRVDTERFTRFLYYFASEPDVGYGVREEMQKFLQDASSTTRFNDPRDFHQRSVAISQKLMMIINYTT